MTDNQMRVLALALAGIAMVAYSITLVSPGVFWLAVGLSCCWLAVSIYERPGGKSQESLGRISESDVHVRSASTEPPVWSGEVPAVEVPVAAVPVAESPAVPVPVAESPAFEVPVAEGPAFEGPAFEVPVAEEPMVEVPPPEPEFLPPVLPSLADLVPQTAQQATAPEAAAPQPKAPPKRLQAIATTYQDGLPPKTHHVRLRIGGSVRRRP